MGPKYVEERRAFNFCFVMKGNDEEGTSDESLGTGADGDKLPAARGS